MNRIAFFVEGQTEQIFVNRLVREILGPQDTNIIQKQFRGGTNIPKQEIVRSLSLSRTPLYEVLIFDCGSDNRVKSEILENIQNLRERGYSKIVGLRDLYPIPFAELGKLEMGLRFLPNRFKHEAPYFDVIVAVHEIEAWFLAEVNHFKKIDRRLDGNFIKKHLGIDPYVMNPEARVHPAKDLDNIYQLVGRSYTKRYGQTEKIVSKLDFNNIMKNLRYEIAPLNRLIKVLEKTKNRK